jgi:methionyl-tRNA formyltransferase
MINVHASLLPRLRGAAPINWAILRGDDTTGITIMRMEEGLDSGPILHQAATPIGPEEAAGQLTDRLARLGAETLIEALALLRLGRLPPRSQDAALATYAPKINREITRVNWANDAVSISRRIRAFDPAPGAWTTFGGLELKLFGARPGQGAGSPGTVLDARDALTVAAGDGAVEIGEVQPAGKPRMPAQAWTRGRGAREGEVFA